MRRNQFLILGVVVALAGCSDGKGDIVETSLPPGQARVTLTRMTSTESRVTNITTTVDSVNSRFETVTCVAEGTSACPQTERHSGDVPEAAITQLFATAQSAEFLALLDEYRIGNDNTPPDGGWTILTVRAGSVEKTVRWETNFPIPDLLGRYVCWIEGIRGSLGLCAG